MKKRLLLLFLIFPLWLSAQKTDDDVKNTIIQFFEQLANRNTEKLKEYCTHDVQILESGEIWTLDTLIKYVKQDKAPDFKRINRFEFIDVEIDGNTAWTTYHNWADVTQNGKQYSVHWLETAILRREEGDWKIQVLHSTIIR